MPPKENPQVKEEQRNASQENGLFNDDPFAGAPDPFGMNNPPVEKDDFDPDFGPSGFNGKEFTAMTPAEKEAYNNDVAAIMDELSKTHTVNDDKLREILVDASKHGMLYHPNGEMVSEQNLETLFETLPYVYDANPDRAAYAFSDFIVVEYNPVTEGITDRTFDIDDGSVSMDKAKFLEVEDIYKEKYRYNERLVRREEINARIEATIAENPANRVALQQAVEEVDVPGKSDFDVDYGPDGFNGKKFAEMTDEEKRAYNKDVSEIIDVLAERHYSSDSIFRETMFKACQHGMLYYPDGQMVTEPILEDVFDKARNETNPYWTAHVFSRFVLVEYDPLEKTIGHTEFQHDRGEITMYVPKEDYLDDEGILQKKVDYEEDLAFIERRTAEVIAEREAQWEAERAAHREAQYTALSEEERTALSGENNAPAEEKPAKPFEFTRSVAVENADGVVSSKKFEEMTPDEQRQFFNRNETVLRGLEASETEEDMALWLNDAAGRGILFRRDGSAVAPNAVGDELAKIDETIDKAPFLSDLIFANYNPATKTLGFHPFIVEENKIVVNSEKPLSAAELDQLYKGGVNLPVEEPVAPVQANNAPVQENNAPEEENSVSVQANNAPVQENNIPVQANNAPEEESEISLDDVDISLDKSFVSLDESDISLENADAPVQEEKIVGLRPTGYENKLFADMNEAEKRAYHDGNIQVLNHLFSDEQEPEEIKDWLNIAIDRGMLYHQNGEAAAKEEVAAMLAQVSQSPDYDEKQALVSNFVVADYDPSPEEDKATYYPLRTAGDSVYADGNQKFNEAEWAAKKKEYDAQLDRAYIANLDTLSPKALVDALAENVRALNPARSNAITDKLKTLGLYHDLSYTTSDGVKHEKGFVNVDGQVYLRGNATPSTTDELVRYAEGVNPPKKPSGFFSGVREWWHNNISKLDDFTKYEEQAKEYEITKYYTCVKAGLNVAKPKSVEQYEKEAAVDLYLDANYRNLATEWKALIHSEKNPFDTSFGHNHFKQLLLNDSQLVKDFVNTPAVQKYLSQNYGASFKIFGENGRNPDPIDVAAKNAMIVEGDDIVQRNKWDLLARFADEGLDRDVYTVMNNMANSKDTVKNDAQFMKELETALRKDSEISARIRAELLKSSPEQLATFHDNYHSFHRSDVSFPIEMTAAAAGIVPDDMKNTILNEKCANWLKPLDDLTENLTEAEKDFFKAVKAAFTKYPHIANSASGDFGLLDEKFIQKMAPAAEQYAQVKDYQGIKDLGELGVLEVIAHNDLFGHFTPDKVKDEIQKDINPAFLRKTLWQSVKVEDWSQEFNKFAQNQKTQAFVADFRAAAIAYPNIGEKIVNEHKTIDQNFMNTFATAVNSYAKSEKLGKLSALVAVGKTGLLSKDINEMIDKKCKAVDPDYVSPFASAKLKPSQMSAQERAVNAQHGTQNIESGDKAILVEKAKKYGVDLNALDLDKIDLNENNIVVVGGGNEAGVVDLDDEPAREQSQMGTNV